VPLYRNYQGLLAASGQTTMRLGGDAGAHGDPGFKPLPRFVPIGDGGIVRDRAAGRMWVKDQRRIVPHSATAAMIQVARGQWHAATEYALYDLVNRDPVDAAPYYVCLTAHTSSGSFDTDLAAGKWVQSYWATTALSLAGVWRSACFWNPGSSSVQAVDELDYGGYADWRIPTQLELCSLIDWERDGYAGETAWFYADSICAPSDQTLWTCNVLASDTDFVCQYGPENEFAPAHHSGAGVPIAVRGC
jgi:hypothetical protein